MRHNPWGIGGGCYACRCYLDAFITVFADAQFDVCVCEEYLPKMDLKKMYPNVDFIPVKERSLLDKLLVPFTKIMHRHKKIACTLLKEKTYNLCIFDDNGIAGTLVLDAKKYGCRTVVINHNCELEYFRDNLTGVKKRLLLPIVRYNENLSYKKCDYNIFLTKEDHDLFHTIYGETMAKNIVLGCFLHKDELFSIDDRVCFHSNNLSLVISGTIGNIQNLDGIMFFLDELYPKVPQNMEIVITGKNAPSHLREKIKKYKNVRLIENPKELLSIVNECDIFVCPTKLGGGMKLRLIDGLRCGLPVIAHKVSARGYSDFEEKGFLYSFETPEQFQEMLFYVIQQIENKQITRESIIDFSKEIFEFHNAISRLSIIK